MPKCLDATNTIAVLELLNSVSDTLRSGAAAPDVPLRVRQTLSDRLGTVDSLRLHLSGMRSNDARPAKPWPSFPLHVHPNGQWYKQVKGRRYYFGKWADDRSGDRAIRNWLNRKDGIFGGLDSLRVAPPETLTIAALIARYLSARSEDLKAGRIAHATYKDYMLELGRFKRGREDGDPTALLPGHWAAYLKTELRERRKLGTAATNKAIRYLRGCFNYADREGWIPKPKFGNAFRAFTSDESRVALIRAGQTPKSDIVLAAAEIDRLLAEADPQYAAMILLGLNAAFGPSDIARLRWKDIDFETGRLTTYRGKTGLKREAYLWNRTRAALRKVRGLKHNQAAYERDGENALVFHTRHNLPFIRWKTEEQNGSITRVTTGNALNAMSLKLFRRAGVRGSFYSLRHTHRTLADDGKDQNANLRTMGHALRGMDRIYVNGPLELDRLKGVARTVWQKLWPNQRDSAD